MQQRQCVVLFGDRAWCESSTSQLLVDFNRRHLLFLSDEPVADFQTTNTKQAKRCLGQEFDAVVFDGRLAFHPDSFGQSVGTLNAGGVFILWLAVEDVRPYSQRFRRVVAQFSGQYSDFHCVDQNQILPELTAPDRAQYASDYQTSDQEQAIKAILKVVEGHRRRPLVLSADRGRGKSAVLGIAAAQLLRGSQRKIIVTAPSLSATEAVFRHAALSLQVTEHSAGLIQFEGAELRFVAPDTLLAGDYKADLLLVDEAAVIPSPMLAKLLHQYSRIVFATTLHGYEGTGRGFAVRFQSLLDVQAPGWRDCHMLEPVRWRSDDALEAFSFDALLLDAEPVEDRLVLGVELAQCSIELVDKKALLGNEVHLKQLFGLMVLAHYRTKPSDLQLLLNSEDINLYIVRYNEHIVASAWLVDEGALAPALSEAIYRGERRLKGHLLPQSLLAHMGIPLAGSLRYQRVLRIAVHPVLQRRGFAKALMTKVLNIAKDGEVDMVGTSFAADLDVMSFWRDSGFSIIRLGTQRDEVSGQYAVTLLHSCSVDGALLLDTAKRQFRQQWPDLLTMQFNQLAIDTVLAISAQCDREPSVLSESDKQEIMRFAYANATYESCQVAIRTSVSSALNSDAFFRLSLEHQQLLVMRVLQLNSIVEVVRALGFSGKAEFIAALRLASACLLEAFAAEDNLIVASE